MSRQGAPKGGMYLHVAPQRHLIGPITPDSTLKRGINAVPRPDLRLDLAESHARLAFSWRLTHRLADR